MSLSMETGYGLLGLLVVLLLLWLLIRWRRAAAAIPVIPKLTPVEMTFRSILEKAVGDRYRVHCKVPITQLIEPSQAKSPGQVKRALRAVSGKIIDYVVCNATDGEIICLVELDDHRYESNKDYRRDLELEGFCYQVALPILRVPVQKGYNLTELIERFENTVASMSENELQQVSALADARKVSFEPLSAT
ncbi:DUF2726 domain-containing protein [Neptuniibacter sp. CAU 1671]|uniref:DUF2726 domain-containing protein n=1 Tax=Neptuniibacter sp. CAU 1671 TaxID=3032593 RepID=UPI0023DC6956|nr:DUF2726 domain-containing protein [Neptuniibacter sp. CAU 1671]MDF2181869.1 DUF2726 domain-containing protein [Neptuniibacter sp. CAU 1671]